MKYTLIYLRIFIKLKLIIIDIRDVFEKFLRDNRYKMILEHLDNLDKDSYNTKYNDIESYRTAIKKEIEPILQNIDWGDAVNHLIKYEHNQTIQIMEIWK